jgi:hypothetical protein
MKRTIKNTIIVIRMTVTGIQSILLKAYAPTLTSLNLKSYSNSKNDFFGLLGWRLKNSFDVLMYHICIMLKCVNDCAQKVSLYNKT